MQDVVSLEPHLLHVGRGNSLVALAAAPIGLHGRRLHWGALRLHGRSAIVVVVVVWHSTESRAQEAGGCVHTLSIQAHMTSSIELPADEYPSRQIYTRAGLGRSGPTVVVVDSSGSAACDSAACGSAARVVVVCTERASKSSRHRDNAHGCKPRSKPRPKRLAHCPFKKGFGSPQHIKLGKFEGGPE